MKKIDPEKLPQHIAIIMDGNGRWAEMHALGRITGHKKGAKSVKVGVKACREIGLKDLNVYAFSVENWLRPQEEVDALMNLLDRYLRSELDDMLRHGIRLMAIGDIGSLSRTGRNML